MDEKLVKYLREWDNSFDNCLEEEKFYNFGSYIDLCGMSIEDALNAQNSCCGGGGTSPTNKKNNSVVVSIQDIDGEYELVIDTQYTPDSPVTVKLTLDGTEYSFVTTSKSYKTGIKLDSKYASVSGLSVSSDDEIYKYTVSSTIKSGLFTITYKVDGNVYKTVTYKAGSDVEHVEYETPKGYTFSGWDSEPSVMPEGNITVSGTLSVNEWTLKYVLVTDGVEKTYSEKKVKYGTKLTKLANVTKEGYTFSGWSSIPATMPDEDVLVTGTLTINSYTITYYVDNVKVNEETYVFNSKLTEYNYTEEKEGHTLSSWSPVIPTLMPSKNLTIKATWVKNKYRVVFKSEDTILFDKELEYGSVIPAVAEPSKKGYTFNGWDKETLSTVPAYNVEYNAQFTVNSYTITYKDGDVMLYEDKFNYGENVVKREVPSDRVKEGYTTSEDWDIVLPDVMDDKDYVANVVYTINQYTVTVNGFDGVYTSVTQDYGTAVNIDLSGLEKEGYDYELDGDIPSVIPAEDIVVNAVYTKKTYTVTYNIEGEEPLVREYEFEATIDKYVPEVRVGYTFSGWDNEEPDTMPSENLIFSGKYNVNTWTVTYKVDGNVVDTIENVAYGSDLTISDEPEKEGYTFSGWEGIPEGNKMPDNDVVIEGNFTINTYRLTFVVDGEEVSSEDVEFNSEITYPVVEDREGYDFVWTGEKYTNMPSKDLTVNGVYIVKKYTIKFIVDDNVVTSYTADYNSSLSDKYAEAESKVEKKEGFSFKWDKIYTKMPNNNVTVTGIYSEIVVENKVYYGAVLTEDVENTDYSAFEYIELEPGVETVVTITTPYLDEPDDDASEEEWEKYDETTYSTLFAFPVGSNADIRNNITNTSILGKYANNGEITIDGNQYTLYIRKEGGPVGDKLKLKITI